MAYFHQSLTPGQVDGKLRGKRFAHVAIVVTRKNPRGQFVGPARPKARADVIFRVMKDQFLADPFGNRLIMDQQQLNRDFAAETPLRVATVSKVKRLMMQTPLQRISHAAHPLVFGRSALGLARDIGPDVKRDGIGMGRFTWGARSL